MKTRLWMVCTAVLVALVLVGVSIAAAKSFDLPAFQISVDHPQPLPQVNRPRSNPGAWTRDQLANYRLGARSCSESSGSRSGLG